MIKLYRIISAASLQTASPITLVGSQYANTKNQINITRDAVPAAGSMVVQAKSISTGDWLTISGSIDLTVAAEALNPYLFDGVYSEIRCVLTGLTAPRTVTIEYLSWPN